MKNYLQLFAIVVGHRVRELGSLMFTRRMWTDLDNMSYLYILPSRSIFLFLSDDENDRETIRLKKLQKSSPRQAEVPAERTFDGGCQKSRVYCDSRAEEKGLRSIWVIIRAKNVLEIVKQAIWKLHRRRINEKELIVSTQNQTALFYNSIPNQVDLNHQSLKYNIMSKYILHIWRLEWNLVSGNRDSVYFRQRKCRQ